MDGAPRDFNTGLQCLHLGVAPLEGGQQWGVNVDYSVPPTIHEGLGENPHETRQANELNTSPPEHLVKSSLEILSFGKIFVIHKL